MCLLLCMLYLKYTWWNSRISQSEIFSYFFVSFNCKVSIKVDVSFFFHLQFNPWGSLKCVGISALETIHTIWCLSYFIYPEKLRCLFPCCPWISPVFAFCPWMDGEKLFFLCCTQPVMLLWTDFSSSPVLWLSQEMPADRRKRLSSAEQIPFHHSGGGISWKWLCSRLCVTPSSEQLLKTLPFRASQTLQASSSSVSPWPDICSDAQGPACLPACPKLGNGI